MSNPETSAEIPKNLAGENDASVAGENQERRTDNPIKAQTEGLRKSLWEKRQEALRMQEAAEKKAILAKLGDFVMGRNSEESEWSHSRFEADMRINGVREGENIIEKAGGDLKLALEKILAREEELRVERRKVDPDYDGKPDATDPDAYERLSGSIFGLARVAELIAEEIEKK